MPALQQLNGQNTNFHVLAFLVPDMFIWHQIYMATNGNQSCTDLVEENPELAFRTMFTVELLELLIQVLLTFC